MGSSIVHTLKGATASCSECPPKRCMCEGLASNDDRQCIPQPSSPKGRTTRDTWFTTRDTWCSTGDEAHRCWTVHATADVNNTADDCSVIVPESVATSDTTASSNCIEGFERPAACLVKLASTTMVGVLDVANSSGS